MKIGGSYHATAVVPPTGTAMQTQVSNAPKQEAAPAKKNKDSVTISSAAMSSYQKQQPASKESVQKIQEKLNPLNNLPPTTSDIVSAKK